MITRRQLLKGLAAAPVAAALAACGAATTSSGGAGSSGAASREPVFYGVSGPFSGNNAEYGRIWRKAMTMAVEELNGAGGIKGRQVELIYEDTQSDAKQSVPVAQKFVNDSRILAELGDFASPASMAASPIYQRAGMVQFGFTNSHPDFTKGGDYMFSTTLSQRQDAAFLAETAVAKLGKRQAVLYRNTDWGKTTHGIYVERVKELGGEVVAIENYPEEEKDFRSLLAKVRDTRPEVLALISYYNDGALLMQQARAAGLGGVKVVANGACYSPQFLSLGGEAVNDVVLTAVFFPGNPRPEVQRFVADYRQRNNNETPDSFAAIAYDAVKILAWATERGGFDRGGIRKALAEGTDIPSVIFGPFKFSDERRVENARMVPLQVKNGEFTTFS